MSFYCFNPDCEEWGNAIPQEPHGVWAIHMITDNAGFTDCPKCGSRTWYHDNWDLDNSERRSDDGTIPTK